MPKVPTNKTNFKIEFLVEIIFQNDSYFTGTWTYPVRLPILSMRVKTSASYDAKSTRRLYSNLCFDSTVLLNAMF